MDSDKHLSMLDFRERMMMLGYRKESTLQALWLQARSAQMDGYVPSTHPVDGSHTVVKIITSHC